MQVAMNDMPLVSVIVPIYNTEPYLERCLNSILASTLINIEVICIDDCSTDGSVKVVEAFQKEDKRIKLIKHGSNLGIGAVRTTGIYAAKAEYVASIDSDDYMQPFMLEKLYAAAIDTSADMVQCNAAMLDERGVQIGIVSPFILWDGERRESASPDYKLYYMNAMWLKMVRRKIFIESGVAIPSLSDAEGTFISWILRCLQLKVVTLGDVLYFYCRRSGSITSSPSIGALFDLYESFNKIKIFAIRKGVLANFRTEITRDLIRLLILRRGKYIASSTDSSEVEGFDNVLLELFEGFLDISCSFVFERTGGTTSLSP
jgi:glycosyltransferase involved in cell wall biosynthesis